jgi:hypothetical protein
MAPEPAMPDGRRSVLREGIITGLIGAAVVALWFLVFDLATGKPFFTPGLLGALVFEQVASPTGLSPRLGPIVGYTVIHGLAFIGFGVVAASVMAASEREPKLFIAFVILFACFEAFFFGLLGAVGQFEAGALVWWAVLVGNLLATVAMLGYLFRVHDLVPRGLVSPGAHVLREGVAAGLLGAVVVAVWFLLVDWIQGEPLRTPALLGSGFFHQGGVEGVILYTLVHGVAFVAFGILGAVLIAGAERQPLFIFALVILFTSFEIFFFGLTVIAASWVLDELAGWTIFVGNILAAVVMLTYYFTGHRALARRLATAWAEEE